MSRHSTPAGRADKIRALMNSPVEGERLAAEAAYKRMMGGKPVLGSPEWKEGVRRYRRKIEFCRLHISNASLSAAEIKTIRNMDRYGCSPWDRGASAIDPIYAKLSRVENVVS